MTMNHTSAESLSLRDIFAAAYRQKWKIAAFVTLTLAVTAAVIVWYPRTFRSQAELFVRVGRESVTLDPTATTGQTVAMASDRQLEINSTVQMLQSRALVEKVVDQLGPNIVLGGDEGEDVAASGAPAAFATMIGNVVSTAAQTVSDLDPIDDRERAVQTILNAMSVSSPRNTSVVTVSYEDETPERAQQVTAALLEAFQDEHIRLNRTHGSMDFFVEQSELTKQQWDDAAVKLRDAKNELGLVSIEVQRSLLEQELNRLESQLASSQTSLAATQARVASLETMAKEVPERLVREEEVGFDNVARDSMRQALYDLEIRERELLAKYKEEHPEVVAVRDQVAQAREILKEQKEDRTHVTTARNPSFEKLEVDLITAKAEGKSLEAGTQRLEQEVAIARSKVKSLNESQLLIARLERDVEIAHRNFMIHSEKLEQARIDTALEADRISNINIIQSASLEKKPASPRKGLTAAAGLAVCFLGSVMLVLTGVRGNRSLRTVEDIERRLDMPVLASLPRNGNGNGFPVHTN